MKTVIIFFFFFALRLINGVVSLTPYDMISDNTIYSRDALQVYFVVPENVATNVACQQIECHTLAYYMNYSIRSAPLYFRSNETYIFWSGNHHPLENATVIISNVSNLSLIGNGATIDCRSKSVGFLFKYSINITLQSLNFMSCARTENNFHLSAAPLSFISGFGLTLYRVQLWGSVSGAIFIKNTLGVVELGEVTVTNTNTANKNLPNAGSAIIYTQCFKQTPHLIIKDCTFVNNSNLNDNLAICKGTRRIHKGEQFAGGLTLYLECESVHVDINNLTMRNNSGGKGGNLAILFGKVSSGSVTILESCFESGCSIEGSGLYVGFNAINETNDIKTDCQNLYLILHVANSTFVDNEAVYSGSGVYIMHRQLDNDCGMKQINLTRCMFLNNSLIMSGFGGVALHSITYFVMTKYLFDAVPKLWVQLDRCEFKQNHMTKIKFPTGGNGVVFTKSNPYLRLVNTRISHNTCSGILAVSSNLIFVGKIFITNNNASSGGGLLLCEDSVMYLEAFVNVTIADNIAEHTGGGITVESKCQQSKPLCFYQLGQALLQHPSMVRGIRVNLLNNTAKYAGDNLFGGSVEYCYVVYGPNGGIYRNSTSLFKKVFIISNDTLSSVSSRPQRVCLCQNSSHSCGTSNDNKLRNLKLFPGERFNVSVALVGQLNGLAKGAVEAQLISPPQKKLNHYLSNKLQRISNMSCNTLHYTIYSNRSRLILLLGVEHNGDISGFEQLLLFKKLNISIRMKDCPIGFTLRRYASGGHHCDCIGLFQHPYRSGDIKCDIKRKEIVKNNSNIWIGLTESGSVALHPHCPFDYCKRNHHNIIAVYENHTLDQDSQCSIHRTGIMCGACTEGYSLELGGTRCIQCTNYWLLLYISFAVAGIALIFLLTVLNFTISAGTFSGVVFYCNIIKSNIKSFFPDDSIPFLTPLLKTFVSLINLESGMATCLYNGMDAYWYTWLHFILPLYVLTIAGVFVCLANRVSWIVRNNAVNVLASLILLSYTKLLYISIEAVHVTYLYLEHHLHEARWYHDGNIRYFTGKHIPLVLAAALLGLILLPFTFCLLFIQCLQKASHRSIFKCVHRLKPFFDAYTGPFTSRARFWTGLLLIARLIIYVISTINAEGDPNLNTGAISLVVLLLLFVALTLPQGLYRVHCLNILECWLLFNLGFLSMMVTFSSMISHMKTVTLVGLASTHLCVGTAFITFVGVVLYQTCKIKPIRKCLKYVQFHYIQVRTSSSKLRRYHINEAHHPELASLFDEERDQLVDSSMHEHT